MFLQLLKNFKREFYLERTVSGYIETDSWEHVERALDDGYLMTGPQAYNAITNMLVRSNPKSDKAISKVISHIVDNKPSRLNKALWDLAQAGRPRDHANYYIEKVGGFMCSRKEVSDVLTEKTIRNFIKLEQSRNFCYVSGRLTEILHDKIFRSKTVPVGDNITTMSHEKVTAIKREIGKLDLEALSATEKLELKEVVDQALPQLLKTYQAAREKSNDAALDAVLLEGLVGIELRVGELALSAQNNRVKQLRVAARMSVGRFNNPL